jgi:hypothetical protein
VLALAGLLVVAPSAGAQTRVYSPSFTVDGAVDSPRVFTLADLRALPA